MGKNNLFKILMRSKVSNNKCHIIDTNNQTDKISIKATIKTSAKMKLTKKSIMATLITVWQTTSI